MNEDFALGALESARPYVDPVTGDSLVWDQVVRLGHYLFNIAINNVGLTVVLVLVTTLIFTKVESIRKLVFPSSPILEEGVRLMEKMRERWDDPTDWEPTSTEKLMFGLMFLGAALRSALIFLAIAYLIATISTGGI